MQNRENEQRNEFRTRKFNRISVESKREREAEPQSRKKKKTANGMSRTAVDL